MIKNITKGLRIIALIIVAFSSIQAAEEDQPNEATVEILKLAMRLKEDDKNIEAKALLEKAISEDDAHSLVYMLLATHYATDKKFLEASKLFQEGWERSNGNNVHLLESYAVSLSKLNDTTRLRNIKEDLIKNFDQLKEGRYSIFRLIAEDGDQDLLDRALVMIPLKDINEDTFLAQVIAKTAKLLANNRLESIGKDN